MKEQRLYILEIEDKVSDFVEGLDEKSKRIIYRKLNYLIERPFNNNTKILGRTKKCDGKVIVDDVQTSQKSGKGGKQQKYINKKKKK